jgi:hypothetical protein
VIVAYLLLLAAAVASVAPLGSWGWVAVSAAVAVVEYATPQRSQRFSSRVWRSVRVGRRSSRERATESLYVVTAVASIALLAVAVLKPSDQCGTTRRAANRNITDQARRHADVPFCIAWAWAVIVVMCCRSVALKAAALRDVAGSTDPYVRVRRSCGRTRWRGRRGRRDEWRLAVLETEATGEHP